MIKPVLQVAALGVVGVAMWKLASLFLFPVLFVAFKIALVVGLVMAAIWWFTKQGRKDSPDTPPPPETA